MLDSGSLFGLHLSVVNFLKEKYVGNEMEDGSRAQKGLNLMDKTLMVRGARISYSIWEVGGNYLKDFKMWTCSFMIGWRKGLTWMWMQVIENLWITFQQLARTL